MAVSLGNKAESSVGQKWHDMRDNNNYQKSKGVIEGKAKKSEEKVGVIYYLSRNGQLEHPHFMVVPFSSSQQGLSLKDVINRLSFLRGQGIANMYSWSSKRSYKNGFVWHDLSENDLIQPCQGHEYVLKGSQILESSLSCRSFESTGSSFSSSSSSMFSHETNSPNEDYLASLPNAITRRKSHSNDLREYQVLKPKNAKEMAAKTTNVSTQTEGKAMDRKTSLAEIQEPEIEGSGKDQTTQNSRDYGKTKASTVLMDLIKCGSRGVKGCDSIKRKE